MKNTFVKSIVLFFALAAFLGVALWIPIGMMGMERHEGMPMTDCPFMFGEEALCAMSVFEHISLWQAMMTAIPPEIVVLVLLAAAALWFLRYLYDPPDLSSTRFYIPLRFSYTSLFCSLLLGSAISPRAP
jgi:hypothetical protein